MVGPYGGVVESFGGPQTRFVSGRYRGVGAQGEDLVAVTFERTCSRRWVAVAYSQKPHRLSASSGVGRDAQTEQVCVAVLHGPGYGTGAVVRRTASH